MQCCIQPLARARQGNTRDRTVVSLPWDLLSIGWRTSTTTAPNALQPSLTCVVCLVPVRNLTLLECIWLVPSVVQTHHLLCKWGSSGNFYTRRDSCPGKGILCRQNGAPQAVHRVSASMGADNTRVHVKKTWGWWQNRQRCLSQRVSCKRTTVLRLATASSQSCASEWVL